MQIQLQINGEKEVSDMFDLVAALIKDAKAGKGALVIAASHLEGLISAINSIPALSADLKQDMEGSANSALVGSIKIIAALRA